MDNSLRAQEEVFNRAFFRTEREPFAEKRHTQPLFYLRRQAEQWLDHRGRFTEIAFLISELYPGKRLDAKLGMIEVFISTARQKGGYAGKPPRQLRKPKVLAALRRAYKLAYRQPPRWLDEDLSPTPVKLVWVEPMRRRGPRSLLKPL